MLEPPKRRRNALLETRLVFQLVMEQRFSGTVEWILNRMIRAVFSQHTLNPDISVEVFVLDRDGADEAPGGGSPSNTRWCGVAAPTPRSGCVASDGERCVRNSADRGRQDVVAQRLQGLVRAAIAADQRIADRNRPDHPCGTMQSLTSRKGSAVCSVGRLRLRRGFWFAPLPPPPPGAAGGGRRATA